MLVFYGKRLQELFLLTVHDSLLNIFMHGCHLLLLQPEAVVKWDHLLFVTQEKSFDLGSADPHGSPMAVNPWLEICQLKRIC
jgi:hypothetical protein